MFKKTPNIKLFNSDISSSKNAYVINYNECEISEKMRCFIKGCKANKVPKKFIETKD